MNKWEIVRLGDVAKINMGQSPKSYSYNEKGEGLPFYQGNADFGDLYPKVRYYCSEPIKIALKDDILISVRAPIGALNIAMEKCCIGRGLAAITEIEGITHYKFLYYMLMSKYDELNLKGTGSTFKAINKQNLSDIVFSLPSIEIQKQIAKTLDKASELINLRKKQFEELNNLIKSVFYDMFGDPATNEKGWDKVKIEDICDVERGGSPRPIDNYITEEENGVNWIKIGDADNSMYITKTREKIKPEGVKKSRFVRAGDFLLSNSMSFGRPYILKIDGCIHDGWLVLRNRNKAYINEYLYYALSSEATYAQFKIRAVGGVVNNLNSSLVKSVLILLPPLYLQIKFAEIVSRIEEQKSLVQKTIDESQYLFDSLISKYFD
ncbi:MAG: restriction endonuclease subunit S [Clostridiales bacterium]|nr:restriction endonuclease subunit S [Clostridiales bacterium]